MIHGTPYKTLKQHLKKLYNVHATDLDNGVSVPDSIYCVKPYFRYNGKWLPQDFCKIGKASSIANRVRVYNQAGLDVRTLWTLDLRSRKYTNSMEEKVHLFGEDIRAKDESPYGTELFNLNVDQAYEFLYRFIKFHGFYGIKHVNIFDNFNLETLIVKNYKQQTFGNSFDRLFDISGTPDDTSAEDHMIKLLEQYCEYAA